MPFINNPNKVHNPFFTYPMDFMTASLWELTDVDILDQPSPVALRQAQINNGGWLKQEQIFLDPGESKTWLAGVVLAGLDNGRARLKIEAVNAYRKIAGVVTKKIDVIKNYWTTEQMEFKLPPNCMIANITIESIDGVIFVGEVFIIKTENKEISLTKQSPAIAGYTNHMPRQYGIDFVGFISLPSERNLGNYELDLDSLPKMIKTYVTSEPALKSNMNLLLKDPLPVLAETKSLVSQGGAVYGTNPWIPAIYPRQLTIDGEVKEELCRIPFLNQLEKYYIKTGGTIPANEERFYRVTAVTAFGESTPGNEVKFVAASDSSSNRFPLEITPVPGAITYRVYMTKTKKDPTPAPFPGDFEIGDYRKGNHLLFEINHTALIDAGCLVYDDGSYQMQSGTFPQVHEGRFWQANPADGTMTFSEAQSGEIRTDIPVDEEIVAMDHLTNEKYVYLVTITGVYQWDQILRPETAVKVLERDGIIDICHLINGDLWCLLNDGRFISLSEQIVGQVTLNNGGCCSLLWAGLEYFAKVTTAGEVIFYSTSGAEVARNAPVYPEGNSGIFKGIKSWGPLILVGDPKKRCWHVYLISENFRLTYAQQLAWPLLDVKGFSLTGSYLSINSSGYLYTFKVDLNADCVEQKTLGLDGDSLKYLNLNREFMIGETIPAVFPEILENGDFSAGLSGYLTPGKKGTVEHGYYTICFFGTETDGWGILEKQIPIRKSGKYILSFKRKTIGGEMSRFIVLRSDAPGLDLWISVSYNNEEQTAAIDFTIPEGSKKLSLRFYFGWLEGKDIAYMLGDVKVTYRLDENLPAGELLENRIFEVTLDQKMPLSWIIRGNGASAAIYSLIDPEGEQGKAWQVFLPKYDLKLDNWKNIASKKYRVNPGDKLLFRILAKVDQPRTSQMEIRFYNQAGDLLHQQITGAATDARLKSFSVEAAAPDNTYTAEAMPPQNYEADKPDPTFTFENASMVLLDPENSSVNAIPDTSFDYGFLFLDALKISEMCQSEISETERIIKVICSINKKGIPIDAAGIPISFSVAPLGTVVKEFKTNTKGVATAIISVPNTPGSYSIVANYKTVKDTYSIEVPNVFPVGAFIKLLPSEAAKGSLPARGKFIIVEVDAPVRRKPFPTCEGRVGVWNVFRPTLYNEHAMLDYDFQVSPSSNQQALEFQTGDRFWYTKDRYAHLVNWFYIDDLSDYPHETSHEEIHEKRPDWFLQNSSGDYDTPFTTVDGRHYYDRSLPECNQWYTRRGLNWAIESKWDGVYVDDFWGESFATEKEGQDKCQLLNYPTKISRQDAIANFWECFKQIAHRFGFWLTSNYPYHVPGDNLAWAILEQPWDGYLREVWGYAGDQPDVGYSTNLEYCKRDIDTLAHWQSQNKFALVIGRCPGWAFQARMYILAKYLLGKGNLSFLYVCGYTLYGWGEGYAPKILPEHRLRTGVPLGTYTLNDGVFVREFERCLVILNGNTTQRTYNLAQEINWRDIFGHNVSQEQTLEPNSGYVFMKGVPTF